MNEHAVYNVECEHVCAWIWPFGFVPENGCPTHDQPGRSPRDGRLWEGVRRRIAIWWPVAASGAVYPPRSLN